MCALAIVPARSGSKTIPKKNIKKFGLHPLIAYSIEAGLRAQTVSRVIVSTDDEEIGDIAKYYGAEVPVLRPKELGQDDTDDFPVIEHMMNWLENNNGYHQEILVFLRPTSPFRSRNLVDDAVYLLKSNNEADSVRAVIPSTQTPYKMWTVKNNDFLHPILKSNLKEHYNLPRQRLPKTFWQSGHIEVIRANTIKIKNSITGDNILPYFLDEKYAVDIDTEMDWENAENRLKKITNDIVTPSKNYLENIEMIVFDFDGVFTDNKVYLSENGYESVLCDRSDGLAISRLKDAKIKMLVLSSEKNEVVKMRCQKLNIQCFQGVSNKLLELQKISNDLNIPLENIAFIGNDINDLECVVNAGLGIAVGDANPELINCADMVLDKNGGNGAIAEFSRLFFEFNLHNK